MLILSLSQKNYKLANSLQGYLYTKKQEQSIHKLIFFRPPITIRAKKNIDDRRQSRVSLYINQISQTINIPIKKIQARKKCQKNFFRVPSI